MAKNDRLHRHDIVDFCYDIYGNPILHASGKTPKMLDDLLLDYGPAGAMEIAQKCGYAVSAIGQLAASKFTETY